MRGAQKSSGRKVMFGIVVTAAVVAGLVAWRLHTAPHGGSAAAGKGERATPVVTVGVVRQDMPIWLEGLGTVQAYNTVAIHSRIDGELVDLAFREGEDAHTGQVLARIDPRSYQAALEQAQAARDKDVVQLDQARLDMQRYLSLGNRVAGQTVDTQRATVRQLEATVKGDQANIDSAKTQLSYTTIASPLDGVIGIRNLDKGNIVHAADATALVTISQVQPIAVTFTLPQQNFRAIADAMGKGHPLAVQALDADSRAIVDQGELQLIDNQIDQTTGTIRLKAAMPNAQRHLWPGAFVTMRLLLTNRTGVLVVPVQVVQRGPQGAYVYVVKSDRTVDMRSVTLGPVENGVVVIEDGLHEGEVVVLDGAAKLKPGAKVAQAGDKPAKDQK